MKIQCPYRCDSDGCTNQKGEGNHWMMVIPVDHEMVQFVARPWDQKIVDDDDALTVSNPTRLRIAHYCGVGCLSKALSSWHTKISMVDSKVPV